MDNVRVYFNVVDPAKPRIHVNSLPALIVDKVVMDPSVLARLFDVDAFFVVVIDMIIGDLKIDGATDADCFMWRLA